MSTYDLWIRDITGGPNQPTGSPPIGPFGNWAFWQYNNTSTVGGIGPIDQDILNSDSFSLADLTITPEPASAVILLTLGAMTLATRPTPLRLINEMTPPLHRKVSEFCT